MLKKEFIKNNREFKQVLETSNFFMYQVIAYGNDNYQDVYYELFKKAPKIEKVYGDNGWAKTGDRTYYYPSNSDFGLWAWCCSNEKCVMKVLKKLQVNEDEISVFKDFFLQGNTRVPSKGESV